MSRVTVSDQDLCTVKTKASYNVYNTMITFFKIESKTI